MNRSLAAILLVASLFGACGDDTETASTPTTTTTTADQETTTTTEESTGLEQPAIWPAAGVVFDTPEEAARDFVSKVLEVPPSLGEFRQGDNRSGEIEVYSRGESGGRSVVRGTLRLRQLGPDDGWFIIGAANDNASITSPDSGAEVEAGPVEVAGRARGFEANVVVTARVAGDADSQLDQEITQGGAFADPEPYRVTLDLSSASPGDTVMLLVRGGTGLETDPGDFGAIPVVVDG